MNLAVNYRGLSMELETDPRLFSPSGPDPGSLAMLSCVHLQENEKILDLGCGYGLVGIALAKIDELNHIVMADIDQLAIELAMKNAKRNGCKNISAVLSNGFESIKDDDFTLILSNPPYHTDFSVPKSFIEGSFRHLSFGGRLIMVVKRRLWYENKLKSVFGGVRVRSIDGYYVLESEKRLYRSTTTSDNRSTKKHEKKIARSKSNIAR